MHSDFENKLSNIKIKPPSEDYKLTAHRLLKTIESDNSKFNWSYILALGLIFSMALNWYQYLQPAKIDIQPPLLVENSNAQKTTNGYSMTQGAFVPYGGTRDITIILEN